MPNPYLKRGSSNRGSKNKGSKQTEERGLKKFWKKHKAIIIGTSIAVISIPVGVAIYRKMKTPALTTESLLPSANRLEFSHPNAKKSNVKDEDIIDAMLIDEEEGSKMEIMMEEEDMEADVLKMPAIPKNPRAKVTFSAADFE